MRHIPVVLFAVALCATSHGPASADIALDCYRATAEKPVSNDKIIAVCTQAVHATSGTRRAASLHNRGIGHMQKGELDAALTDFDESIRLNPDDLWPRSSRANLYRLKGAYDRALSELNEIIRRDPNSIGAYADRGMVHQERGDLESARSDFQAVLGLKDKNPDLERWAKDQARRRLDELAKK